MFGYSTALLLASGDIPGAVIWLVLIVGITVVQKAVEYMNKKKNEQADSSGDKAPWKPLPRRIEDVIRNIEKAREPSQQEEPRRDPVTQIRKQKPVKTVKPARPREMTTMEQAAQSMNEMSSPTATAQYSVDGLSDAERSALERLKKGRGEMQPVPAMNVARAVSRQAVPADSLRAGLATRSALQTAILYQEILGKPIALRD